MNKKLIGFSGIIIFVFGYILYETKKIDSKLSSTDLSTGTVIKRIPAVNFTDFNSGEVVNTAKLAEAGNFLFVHFWATWCGPCELEFPDLTEMINLLKDKKNLKFLLVAVNDDKTKMKKFLNKFDLNLDNVLILEDKTDAHKQYGTYKMSETFLFNPKKEIVKKYTGQQAWSQTYLVNSLKSL